LELSTSINASADDEECVMWFIQKYIRRGRFKQGNLNNLVMALDFKSCRSLTHKFKQDRMYVKLGVLIYLENTTNVSSDLSLRPTFALILSLTSWFLITFSSLHTQAVVRTN